MNYDELAFFNQQLATMLKSGIPLEGALHQLSLGMKRGAFRNELEQLSQDLKQGLSFPEALGRRKLPEVYTRMLIVGAQSENFPGLLTLLADYYERANHLWLRLKGLMVYPLLVLLVGLGISLLLAVNFRNISQSLVAGTDMAPLNSNLNSGIIFSFFPFFTIALLILLWVVVVSVPYFRRWASWTLPGFREAALWRFSAAAALLLRGGRPVDSALALLYEFEKGSPAGTQVAIWRSNLARGQKQFIQIDDDRGTFPQLFNWILSQSGEDLPGGFQQAADIYYARAAYRSEMLLYAALPSAIVVLGALILAGAFPYLNFISQFTYFMDAF